MQVQEPYNMTFARFAAAFCPSLLRAACGAGDVRRLSIVPTGRWSLNTGFQPRRSAEYKYGDHCSSAVSGLQPFRRGGYGLGMNMSSRELVLTRPPPPRRLLATRYGRNRLTSAEKYGKAAGSV